MLFKRLEHTKYLFKECHTGFELKIPDYSFWVELKKENKLEMSSARRTKLHHF